MRKMRAFATALSVALTVPAFAADLPALKAPPYVPPPPLWAGFYGGLNAGGTFSTGSGVTNSSGDLYDDYALAAAGAAGAASAIVSGSGNSNNSGILGGGQLGYNFQFHQNLLAGLEVDLQAISGSNSGVVVGAAPDPQGTATQMVTTGQYKASLDYLGTLRGRAGFLLSPTWLAYATGGLAYGAANLSATFATVDAAGLYGPGYGPSTYSQTRVGWTVGAGVEWMFLPNWSAKVEYLYYDLGTVTTNSVVSGLNNLSGAVGYAYGTSTSAPFNGHIVRAGVNYHLSWFAPSPVLAKY